VFSGKKKVQRAVTIIQNSRDTTNYSLIISKIAAAFSMNFSAEAITALAPD